MACAPSTMQLNKRLRKTLPTLPAGVSEIAWKATQERLHRKFARLTFHRKPPAKVADGRRPRVRGLHLGNRPTGRRATRPPARRSLDADDHTMNPEMTGRAQHGKENPRKSLCGNQPAMPSLEAAPDASKTVRYVVAITVAATNPRISA